VLPAREGFQQQAWLFYAVPTDNGAEQTERKGGNRQKIWVQLRGKITYQKLLGREGVQVHPVGEIAVAGEVVELDAGLERDVKQGVRAENRQEYIKPRRSETCGRQHRQRNGEESG